MGKVLFTSIAIWILIVFIIMAMVNAVLLAQITCDFSLEYFPITLTVFYMLATMNTVYVVCTFMRRRTRHATDSETNLLQDVEHHEEHTTDDHSQATANVNTLFLASPPIRFAFIVVNLLPFVLCIIWLITFVTTPVPDTQKCRSRYWFNLAQLIVHSSFSVVGIIVSCSSACVLLNCPKRITCLE